MEMYYSMPSVESYGGINATKRATREKTKDVKSWLSAQNAYSLHKPVRKKFRRRKTFAVGIDHLHQADLADFSSLARHNNGYRFVLVVVDVFSKFCWLRALKDKTALSIRDAYRDILFSDYRKPVYLQSDGGRSLLILCFKTF